MTLVGAVSEYANTRHLNGVTAVVLSWMAGVEDAHGNVTESWVESAVLHGCAFDPGSTSEPRLAGHDRVIVQPALYVSYDAPVGPLDRIVVDGRTFTVEGGPRRWCSPFTGKNAGSVITLQEVSG